jgi:hypothetical protein
MGLVNTLWVCMRHFCPKMLYVLSACIHALKIWHRHEIT